jgi:hypothetical protein
MPQYPETKDLTWKERFVIEEAYLKKTIDFIQGRKAETDGCIPTSPKSSVTHSERSSRKTEDRQAESHRLCEADGTLSDR